MAEISAKEVNDLRKSTGLGLMECKRLLQDASGDFQKALQLARERGIKLAEKRAERSARAGRIECYIHHDGKSAAMVEVNCETDFVARNDEFRQLCKNVALQVVATHPLCVRREDLTPEVVAERKHTIEQVMQAEGTDSATGKDANARLDDWFAEVVLLDQPFVKDPAHTIGQLVLEVNARTGEKVSIARFARYVVGEVPLA